MKTSPNDYNVSALRKSIAVLEVLTKSGSSLGVTEISRNSGVSKNMVFRILETLEDLGWVKQTAEGPKFSLTLVPLRFFASTQAKADLLEHALPILRALHDDLAETVYISVLHQGKALNIQVLQGTREISVSGKIGGEYDLHCTAPGKILLAGMDASALAQALHKPLKKHTPSTLTNGDELRAQLKQVQKQGYAVNAEEYGQGLLGLAAPVHDAEGRVLAAIGVFVPTTNMTAAGMESAFAGKVCRAGTKLSELLGYQA